MQLSEEIEKLIIYDKSNIHKKISELKKKLNIDKKLNSLVNFTDDIDYIFLRNINIEKQDSVIKDQLIINCDKNLEILCVINGKKKYLKSFGKISKVNNEMLRNIIEFIILVRLSKKLSEVSYYASQFHSLDKLSLELNQ